MSNAGLQVTGSGLQEEVLPARNPSVSDYKDLIVWQKARLFVKRVYQITSSFPSSELYGLTTQIRRAAVSITSNIAEGHSRGSRKDYAQFVSISYGSASECENLLFLAADLDFINAETAKAAFESIREILRMLNKLRQSLRN